MYLKVLQVEGSDLTAILSEMFHYIQETYIT